MKSPWLIDLVNCILIIAVGILSWFAPYATFIFAYAFLGPLHYLTEISWLDTRNYFLTRPSDWKILLLVCIAAFIASFLPNILPLLIDVDRGALALWSQRLAITLGALAFFLSLLLIVPSARQFMMIFSVLFACTVFYFCTTGAEFSLFLIFGVFLPTLIHVSLFTLVFMVNGAAKNRSLFGWISIILYVLTSATLLLSYRWQDIFSSYLNETFFEMFGYLSEFVISNFLSIFVDSNTFSHNQLSVAVVRFIAFAYLYHYCNWFSKTSVIAWNKISLKRGILIFSIWMFLVGAALLDFQLGFLLSSALSFIHVGLEYPLNWRSFKQFIQPLRRAHS